MDVAFSEKFDAKRYARAIGRALAYSWRCLTAFTWCMLAAGLMLAFACWLNGWTGDVSSVCAMFVFAAVMLLWRFVAVRICVCHAQRMFGGGETITTRLTDEGFETTCGDVVQKMPWRKVASHYHFVDDDTVSLMLKSSTPVMFMHGLREHGVDRGELEAAFRQAGLQPFGKSRRCRAALVISVLFSAVILLAALLNACSAVATCCNDMICRETQIRLFDMLPRRVSDSCRPEPFDALRARVVRALTGLRGPDEFAYVFNPDDEYDKVGLLARYGKWSCEAYYPCGCACGHWRGYWESLRTNHTSKVHFEADRGKWLEKVRSLGRDPLPERSVYFATHFNNWYEEASDEEVVRYVEELSEWGLTGVAAWFDMHDFAGMDDPAAKRRLERLKLVFRTAKRLGLGRDLLFLANESFKDSPPELRADWRAGKNGYTRDLVGHYHVELCPSKPGATELLLKWRREVFAAFADAPPTSVTAFPYDQGGCTCSNCAPWGANAYLRLCRCIADLAREMYPGAKFNLSTWRFDVFGKLGEWDGLFAKGDELRGWVDRIYVDPCDLARTKDRSPGGLPVFAMSEISMSGMLPWGGYGANPMPARLQDEFGRNPNIAGLRPYSEGIYEDVNKVVVLGMLRDPGRSALDVVGDYAARYFGEGAREPVKAAAALMEVNMGHRAAAVQGDVSRSPYSLQGLDPVKPWSVRHVCAKLDAAKARRVMQLLDAAERTMDAPRRASWRWRLLRLRAELDSALARGAGPDELEPFFAELARIYRVSPKTLTYLVPPSKPLWLSVVGTWRDAGL